MHLARRHQLLQRAEGGFNPTTPFPGPAQPGSHTGGHLTAPVVARLAWFLDDAHGPRPVCRVGRGEPCIAHPRSRETVAPGSVRPGDQLRTRHPAPVGQREDGGPLALYDHGAVLGGVRGASNFASPNPLAATPRAYWGRFVRNALEGPWPDRPPWAIQRGAVNPRDPRRARRSRPSRVRARTAISRTPRPAVSQPQAPVLALWRVGMGLARSWAWTAGTAFLARGGAARSRPSGNSGGLGSRRAARARPRRAGRRRLDLVAAAPRGQSRRREPRQDPAGCVGGPAPATPPAARPSAALGQGLSPRWEPASGRTARPRARAPGGVSPRALACRAS